MSRKINQRLERLEDFKYEINNQLSVKSKWDDSRVIHKLTISERLYLLEEKVDVLWLLLDYFSLEPTENRALKKVKRSKKNLDGNKE